MKQSIIKINTSASINYVKQENFLASQRSNKSPQNKCQFLERQYLISFETDFLKQHWNSFLNAYNQCFEMLKLSELTWKFISPILQNYSFKQQQQQILKLVQGKPIFETEQRRDFRSIIIKKQKLLTFYWLIVSNLSERESTELIYIGYCICKKYQKIQNNLILLQSQKYLHWVKDTTNSFVKQLIQQKEKIAHFLSKSTNQFKLINFMTIYCQTILLIIQEYFDNPNATQQSIWA